MEEEYPTKTTPEPHICGGNDNCPGLYTPAQSPNSSGSEIGRLISNLIVKSDEKSAELSIPVLAELTGGTECIISYIIIFVS